MTLFQELILISLGKRDKFSRRLSDADWDLIYTEAQRQSLVGVMLTGVERVIATGERKPGDLMKWISQTLILENKNRLQNVKCKEITDIFRSLGLRSCVLKGQGVAMLYPNPLRRQCGDIDLWVEGNRDDIYKILKTRWKVCDTVIHHADVKFFNDTPTEIHFIPSFAYSPLLFHRYKKFFKKFENSQFANYDETIGFAFPKYSFNVVYSLMHIFHHVLHEGIGLRQFLDYYYIIRSLDKEQRQKAFAEIKHLSLTKFAQSVMYVEQQMFELESEYFLCNPNEKMGKCLLKEIALSGNFGQYDKRYEHVNRKNRTDLYAHNVKRNFVFFKFAPSEVLWAPIWKPCHFVWRKIKGYN